MVAGSWGRRLALGCLLLTQPGPAASADEFYDSGWSVASPRVASSALGPSRVPADRLIGKRVLERLELPDKKPAHKDPKLEWRPARTALRPDSGSSSSGDSVLPPLPLSEQPPVEGPTLAPAAPPALKPTLPPQIDNAFRVPDVADSGAAPEMQALPEESGDAPQKHRPAPFSAAAAKPIDAEDPPRDNDANAAPQQSEAETQKPNAAPTAPAKPAPPAAAEKPSQEEQHADRPEAEAPQADRQQAQAPAEEPRRTSEPPKTDDPPRETQPLKTQPRKTQPAPSQANNRNFATPKEVDRPKPALKPMTRSQANLRRRLRSVLSYYYRRPLNNVDHDAWEVMHSMLSYGLYSRVQDGGRRGKPVTAVGYLCFNKPCKRYQMLYLTPEGNLDVRVGVGMQGHKGQLLAMLAQCNVSPDYPIRVEGQEFAVRDLVTAEQLTCYARSELTFKLIGLMHYLPSDTTWVNDQGEHWDFPKLIADERTQKIRGAACGGTHRLSGLALAAKKRVARGEPLDGEWLEAAKFVEEYQAYALRLQNPDGSLSTEWFRGPGDEEDIDRRIRTTGHILEWLIYSLPEEQLADRRVFMAVNYLTNLITSNTDNGWEIGPLAHALHALALYDEKVFQPYDEPSANQVAGRSNRPVTLNYQDLRSGISENYYYIQARHEERENRGLGGLFGFGQSTRRSR